MLSDTANISLWDIYSDPKRRQILQLLMEKPRTTSELCAHFDVSRFAVMKHLKVLESSGLIDVKREGRQRWNVLDRARLRQLARQDGLNEVGLVACEAETAVSPHLCHIPLSFPFNTPASVLYHALVTEIDAWWCYRQLANSHMVLEPMVNGRFYEAEAFNTQTGILLGTVTAIIPNKEIHFYGPMGIADQAIISNLTLTLEPNGPTTQLHLRHHLFGEIEDATYRWYMHRWQNLIETGLVKHLAQTLPNVAEAT